MMEDRRGIAADFDVRSANYSKNQWHGAYAEGLIAHSALRLGDRVLDAGVGTGFAALAAAVRVGPRGRVVGVDVSPGMLQQARIAVEAAGLGNIELLQADACDLRELEDESFDAIVCSAGLLYMPVQRALAEWRRLLKRGGTISFSTMRAGSPQAGQLFRDCAAELGVLLADPSAALGSESAAADVLRQGGFTEISVVPGTVHLADADFACAWESNLRSAAHGQVRSLAPEDLEALRLRFEHALDNRRRIDPLFAVAEVLYVYGAKPDHRHA
jgi:ubiquinone/menaquinone biosynthesis C-methylase UbiE